MIFDYGYHVFSIIIWFLGDIEKVFSWITNRGIYHGWILDRPAVAIWKCKGAEKYGSYEAVTSDDMLVQTQYGRPEDEWIELTGSRGFIWVTRCTSILLDRPPVIMYHDGVTTDFSNMDTSMGASFKIGINDFFDGILAGRQPQLTAEEGKAVFQFVGRYSSRRRGP